MTWEALCQQNPDQWVIIEALEWHDEGEKRNVTNMSLLECFAEDSLTAQRRCNDLLSTQPERQLYFTYTGWDTPRIKTPIKRIRTPRAYANHHQPELVSKIVGDSTN
jgi:hypothetical protein